MRGVGKSMWADKSYKSAKKINLLDEGLYQQYLARPQTFREDINDLKPNSWVIVDEIQRIPSLLNEVHRAIEEKKLKFILLGSSARKLRRSGVNLLGGRALQKFLHPLLPEELGGDFEINKILQFGSIPLIWNSIDPAEQLLSYIQLYIKEEIQAEALVRNLPGFVRFLPIAALFHGQSLNIESISRDCGVARSTVEGYIQILEDTLLAYRLPAYETKLRVRQRSHPKLYWNDSGLVRAIKKQLGSIAIEEKGALFEGYIAQLLKSNQELGRLKCDNLSYWSAGKNSIEVDFVLERGKEIVGVEVKSGINPISNWYGGLKALKEARKVKRCIVVYLGDRKFKHDLGIDVLPLKDFIKELPNL
ncbi:MAG: putative AAA+ superfamily ATPase [Candidatus Omnitrophota bacterium]|jgi:predicted AAA+ superfamily ATPase